ncbi:SEC-C metal-binding domain-containing protein [Aquisalimonas sp. APHAB1-3]|uniref:YecA family protein n=1 Tax=Aquisalimonas sp. APHAB1-3 TaxID=3402080 RepID=UPI003AAB3321
MLPDNAPLDVESLLADAVREALRHEDPGHFMQWIQSTLGDYMAAEFQGPDQAEMRQAMAVHIGRAVWNVMPLPGNHLRPQPLPEPGRNDPCLCGSGRKFKKCCANAPSLPEGLFDPDMMAGLVAESCP